MGIPWKMKAHAQFQQKKHWLVISESNDPQRVGEFFERFLGGSFINISQKNNLHLFKYEDIFPKIFICNACWTRTCGGPAFFYPPPYPPVQTQVHRTQKHTRLLQITFSLQRDSNGNSGEALGCCGPPAEERMHPTSPILHHKLLLSFPNLVTHLRKHEIENPQANMSELVFSSFVIRAWEKGRRKHN